MMLLTFISAALAFALTLLLAPSPLLLGAWILLLTFSIAGILTAATTTWLGIFALLIYVGGLLVMFAYFVALAPNQLLKVKSMFTSSILGMLLGASFLYMAKLFTPGFFNPLENQPTMTALLSSANTGIFILLALILFFTLVAVVKVSTTQSGPLRPWK